MPYIAFLTIEPYHYVLLYFYRLEDKIFAFNIDIQTKNLPLLQRCYIAEEYYDREQPITANK